MGYASYQISGGLHDGEWGGYGHETVCDAEGCDAKIDRGLAYLCGMTPGGSEDSCGGYFCPDHLLFGLTGEGSRCEGCTAEYYEDCPECGGQGSFFNDVPDAPAHRCDACDGDGERRKADA